MPLARAPKLRVFDAPVLLGTCLICVTSPTTPLSAQEEAPLARALEHAARAEFGSALEAFERAESSTGLSRADVAKLYAHRALVRFALGGTEPMEADLVRLIAVDPDAELPATAPPPVRKAYERVRSRVSPLRIVADADHFEDGVHIRARPRGGAPRLLRRVWVFTRSAGQGDWSRSGDEVVTVEATPGETVEWYVEGEGAGGAVLARVGSRSSPRRTRAGGPAGTHRDRAARLLEPDAAGQNSDRSRWWWVGAGALAAAVGAVVAAVVLTRSPGHTSTVVEAPTLQAPED